MDVTTHLLLTRSEAQERRTHAAAHARAAHVARLRRLDRKARTAARRGRHARTAVGPLSAS